MKENEIMIGDWVRSRYKDRGGSETVLDFKVDERIRKAILGLTYLDGIEPILTKCSITRQEIRSYLEKQKEQKPAEWAELQAEFKNINEAFEAGAEWMERKMLEEAVAVEVVGEKRDLRLIDSTQRCLFNANRGDWLKIIIVKEDE